MGMLMLLRGKGTLLTEFDFLSGITPTGLTFSRATTATYFNSAGVRVTAAINEPRYDYDPVTLEPRGLLIERARTNFLLNSGTPATQTVTLGTGTFCLWVEGTGSATSSAGTAVGSGFGAATAGSPNIITITTGGTVDVTVSGTLSLFQLEDGIGTNAFPTSYIPTTGATVTRASDVAYFEMPSWLNATEGTFVVEWMTPVASFNGNRVLEVSASGSTINMMSLLSVAAGPGNQTLTVLNAGAGQSSVNVGPFSGLVVNKNAFRYGQDDFAMSRNGGAISSDTLGTLPAGLNRVGLFVRANAVASEVNHGWMRRLSYYPTKLNDTQLQTLST